MKVGQPGLPTELARPIPRDEVDDLAAQLNARGYENGPDAALAMLRAEKFPALAAYLNKSLDVLCLECIELAVRWIPGFQTADVPARRPNSFTNSELRSVIARMDHAILSGSTIATAAAKEARRYTHTSAKTIKRLYCTVGRPEPEAVVARIERLLRSDPDCTKVTAYVDAVAKWRPNYFRDHGLLR